MRHAGKIAAACIVTSLVLASLFFVLKYILIPSTEMKQIIKQSQFSPDSKLMKVWQNPPYNMTYKIWLFSVENSEQILHNGSKPVLKKHGPYTYRKSIFNEVLGTGNGTVTFKRRSLFHFSKEQSCPDCTEQDRLLIPNMLYQLTVESASRPETAAASRALEAQSPFINLAVEEILFSGYNDPFLDNFCNEGMLKELCKMMFDMPEKFGMFTEANNTYEEGEYTIKDGSKNIKNRGDVVFYNGRTELNKDWWTTDEARKIRGSEASIFHPLIEKGETLYVMSDQQHLCRTLPLQYHGEDTIKGIPVYSFRMHSDEFDSTSVGRAGYCHPTEKIFFRSQNTSWNPNHCYPRGVLPISKCRKNSPPVVVSFSNFAHADGEIRTAVEGLDHPNIEEDGILLDIEPNLGLVIRARQHMQANIEFWAGKGIEKPEYHKTMRSTLIPMAIIHDDAEIDDATLAMVKADLIRPRRTASLVTWSVLAIAALLLATGLYLLLKKLTRPREEKDRDNGKCHDRCEGYANPVARSE